MKAVDYEKENCFVSKHYRKQHKKRDCRYLKNSEIIETNRREAYQKGAKVICVHCWWS